MFGDTFDDIGEYLGMNPQVVGTGYRRELTQLMKQINALTD